MWAEKYQARMIKIDNNERARDPNETERSAIVADGTLAHAVLCGSGGRDDERTRLGTTDEWNGLRDSHSIKWNTSFVWECVCVMRSFVVRLFFLAYV